MRFEEINDKISLFKFSELGKRNKSQLFRIFSAATFKIKQTAFEMWCLLTTFLFIIGSAIPIENSVWELDIFFVQLLERLCEPAFNNEESSVLNYLFKEFYGKYTVLFPETSFKPKAPFLRQYPQMIQKLDHLSKRYVLKPNIVTSKVFTIVQTIGKVYVKLQQNDTNL